MCLSDFCRLEIAVLFGKLFRDIISAFNKICKFALKVQVYTEFKVEK